MGTLARNGLILSLKMKQYQGIIHLVRKQNIPKTEHFFSFETPWDAYKGGKKCQFLGKFCVHTYWMIPTHSCSFDLIEILTKDFVKDTRKKTKYVCLCIEFRKFWRSWNMQMPLFIEKGNTSSYIQKQLFRSALWIYALEIWKLREH